MEINCACQVDYDHTPLIYNVTTPVAKKSHECCECGSEITPGEKYHRVEGLWDCNWETFKTCTPCANLRRDYGCKYTELRQDVWDCLGIDYITGKFARDW